MWTFLNPVAISALVKSLYLKWCSFTMMFLRFLTCIFISQCRLQEVKNTDCFCFTEALHRTNSEVFRTYFYFLSDCTLCAMLNYIIVQSYSPQIRLAQQDHPNIWILEDIGSIYGSIHNRKCKPFSPVLELEWKATGSSKFLRHPHISLSKSVKILMLQRNFISQNSQQHLKYISAFVDCFLMHSFSFKKRWGQKKKKKRWGPTIS